MNQPPTTAFVLGAGLGTRLRPLTDERPKPLVPIFNKPLITFAFDHLIPVGVGRFVINTHHRPEAYARWLGEQNGRGEYRSLPLFFRHEPELLETGGGIKNASDLIGSEPFLVYNGDVLADFPLEGLIESHRRSGRIATLALRSSGGERRIQCDPDTGVITDMRGLIGGRSEPAFLFTGVSVFSPDIFRFIPSGEKISIIPILVELIRMGLPVGGEVIDAGVWFDIGSVPSYMGVHQALFAGDFFFSYLPAGWLKAVSCDAVIHPGVVIRGFSAVAAGAEVGGNAHLDNVIVWPETKVPADVFLRHAVITPGGTYQCDCAEGPDAAW
ncbi:MAG: sugar phosphate nucleotidyltransferase [bacterium]